jgi:hypothetical protein
MSPGIAISFLLQSTTAYNDERTLTITKRKEGETGRETNGSTQSGTAQAHVMSMANIVRSQSCARCVSLDGLLRREPRPLPLAACRRRRHC